MKAIITRRYGGPEVLQLRIVPKPVLKPSEVLIKIHVATVIAGDSEIRRFKIPILFWLPLRLYMGVFRPRIKILGQEMAGVIEEAGSKVTHLKPGDRVFCSSDLSLGTHAEYKALSAKQPIAIIPDNMDFETAACIPVGGLNALHFIRKANAGPEKKVLIIGAGASIGTFTIQLAKLSGAEVHCVDKGSKKEALMAIGADHFIDYQNENFRDMNVKFDAIVDIVGKYTLRSCLHLLKPGGNFVLGNPGLGSMLSGIFVNVFSSKKVFFQLTSYHLEDYNYLSNLVANGQIKCLIDKRFELTEIRDAHVYVDSGEKTGHVVLQIQKDQE